MFAYFTGAFALLVVQRVALSVTASSNPDSIWYYLLRLFAFMLIVVAIIDKNRRPTGSGR